MKRHLIKPLLAATCILAIGACNRLPGSYWTKPAGATLDDARFGVATFSNHQYHTGERSFVVDLNNRFSQEVQSTVNFAFNSAELDSDARAILQVQANWIRQFPEVRFRVFGHADAVGSNSYNKRLGKRRANVVVNYLTSLGVDRSRLEAVISRGEEQPIIVSQGRERLNRRTVTEVSGFKNRNITLDGKYAEIIAREYIDSATELPPDDSGGLDAIADAG